MPTDIVADLALQRDLFLQFVRRRVNSNATAEDILQSAYVRATEKAGGLRSGESAVAWFYRILRNAVIDYYRHRSSEDRALDRWAQALAADNKPDPQTEEFVCKCIQAIMGKLRPAYSEALRQVDLGGNSLESFARSAGITAANAAVRLHRARKALREQLIEFCGICCPQACENCTCS
jgi:RNA polymerase sigma factor (sigma-70 family)